MKFLLWKITIEPYRLAKIQWTLFKLFGIKAKKNPCGHTKSTYGYFCHQPFKMKYCDVINDEKYTFFLSHAPSNTYVIGKRLGRTTLNLFGHTHQTDSPFINDIPYAYNVGLDCHNNKPVLIEQIMNEIHEQYELYRYIKPEVFEKYEQKNNI